MMKIAREGAMRHMKSFVVVSLAALLTVGCGQSEEQKAAERAAEEAKEAAEALKKAAEQTGSAAAAQGIQEFAKAMEGLAGAMAGGASPDGKPATPVSFQELQTALPEVSGWTRDTPRGERMTSPVSFSQSEVSYTQGEANVDVKIVDSAFSQILVAPWAMFLTQGYERESSEGYEKSVNVSGNPGFEKWNSSSKSGELNLVVAKRFLVTIEGNNIVDTKVLHDFASRIDTGRLAALK
jgi:hypothetical protein